MSDIIVALVAQSLDNTSLWCSGTRKKILGIVCLRNGFQKASTQDKNTWEGCTDYCAFRTLHIKHHSCTVLGPPASPLSMLEPHLTILCELLDS